MARSVLSQPTADRLEFESARDCAFAQLVLCGNSRYTIKVL